jgi:hypothetical protein
MTRRLKSLKTVQRIRRIVAELADADRRMFEIRTGVPAARRIDSARDKAMIAELEAHWRI